MSNLTITNTFVAATLAASGQVNTNFSDIKTWLNNRDNATDYWLNMKISSTNSNPAEIKSSATDCEVDIDCTGSNGTPRLTWRRSGSTLFNAGVDGASSNLFKFATTALTTNVAWQVPSTGVQVQFAAGSAATPSLSFIGSSTVGLYTSSGGILFSTAGTSRWTINSIGGLDASSTATITNADGSVGAPSYSFSSTTNMGFWRAGSTTLSCSVNGALAQQWTNTTVSLYTAGSEAFRIDATAVAGNTAMLLYDVSAATIVRVSRGAADSGGAGFRLLRIPN